MEVSPSLVGGHLGLEEVVVGVLVGSRRRCRTSKGEDALRTPGKDAEVVDGVDADVILPEMVARKDVLLSVFSKMRKIACRS